jgi:lipid-A-disaccharide synthase
MAVIFEFEKDLYEKAGVPVRWLGHPLLDVIKVDSTAGQFYKNYNFKNDDILIGLFPGSRAQEIKRILPEMLYALELISIGYPRVKGIIGAAPAIDDDFYETIINQSKSADASWDKALLHRGSNYDLMAHAKVNLVCSGTATLECAMIGTPFVVVYKTSPITYMIARNLIRIPVIGMVNVVAGKKIVPELIQKECNAKNMAAHILNYLNDSNYFNEVRTNLAGIKSKLGENGASRRAAEAAAELIG